MRYSCLLLLLLVACTLPKADLRKSHKELRLKIEAHKKGLKMYTVNNDFLGYSPIQVSLKVKIVKDENTKIVRYFINDREVHSGDTWPFKLKVYMDGFLEEVTLILPFDPTRWTQTAKVSKKEL
jgi:hypothetical protein